MRARVAAGFLFVTTVLAAAPAGAAPHEARIALHDGRLRVGDLSATLCREFHLPAWSPSLGALDAQLACDSDVVAALNESLGDGCRVTASADAMVLHVDPDKLPRRCESISKAVRRFAAVAAPVATAAQADYYGLRLPDRFDPSRPLVVLVHGLDCDRANWHDMAGRLSGNGTQVAYFTYPSDQPIADSATFLGSHLARLRSTFPAARVNLLAHSMGGLVCRAYVEGPDYAGGVDRLIMIGTPNAGSGWSKLRLVLEAQEHYHLWRHEPRWGPSWMITDGLGEAGRDLRPGSAFLRTLNARPRRDGVRYTIIAGNENPVRRVAANCVAASADRITGRAAGWWGLRQCKNGLARTAGRLRDKASDGDGPVKIDSAKLAGVDDFVVVHADHATLCFATGNQPPAAWDLIRDRLSR